MDVSCPACRTRYRVDPRKIPEAGVRARCARCPEEFAIDLIGEAEAPDRDPLPPPPSTSQDPHDFARIQARALVSRILEQNRERRDRSLTRGTLRQELRQEIRSGWEEYVASVGNEMARETSYFQEALNEILAGGSHLF